METVFEMKQKVYSEYKTVLKECAGTPFASEDYYYWSGARSIAELVLGTKVVEAMEKKYAD